MSKRAKSARFSKNTTSGLNLLLLTGVALAAPLLLTQTAAAQQAYYFPQASTAPVSVDYGAITPYAPPAAPGIPAGFQPYGYATPSRVSAQPKSVFTPYGAPAYGAITAPVYGYTAAPADAPFVAPYANPAFAPGFGTNARGLPISTPTANSVPGALLAGGTMVASRNPQSYLNVPGGQPVTLIAPGDTAMADAAPVKKSKKKKKKAAAVEPMPASTPTATEEGAAAQIAAAEAAMEPAPAAAPAVPEAPAAAAEPVPAPTPPAEPAEVPASVPSPAEGAPVSAAAVTGTAPAPEAPAAAPASETPAADAAAEAPAEQVATAEEPAETIPDTGAAAVLPAGATRIVFDGAADDLPQSATADLDAIAEKMLADQDMKVQVLAYSSGTPDAESQARRKALARGLEVRKYLIQKGVRSNRIDVRALGSKSEGSPADRVDIVPAAS